MRNRGFTLIEVLVAIALLAIIALLTWQASGTALVSKERFEAKDELFQGATLALSQMSRDLQGAILYSKIDFLGRSGSGEQRTKSIFLGHDQGDQDKVTFHGITHIRYLKDSKESDQAEISYYLEPDREEPSLWVLKKRESSPPDERPEEGGNEAPLLEGVLELNFRYFDPVKGEFLDQWDSSGMDQLNRLPRAVEIVLVLREPDTEEGKFKFATTVFLEMAPGPSDF